MGTVNQTGAGVHADRRTRRNRSRAAVKRFHIVEEYDEFDSRGDDLLYSGWGDGVWGKSTWTGLPATTETQDDGLDAYQRWLRDHPNGPADDDGQECPVCAGTGEDPTYTPAGKTDARACPACDGWGFSDRLSPVFYDPATGKEGTEPPQAKALVAWADRHAEAEEVLCTSCLNDPTVIYCSKCGIGKDDDDDVAVWVGGGYTRADKHSHWCRCTRCLDQMDADLHPAHCDCATCVNSRPMVLSDAAEAAIENLRRKKGGWPRAGD
ncbi:MAG: hypothetical protein ACOYY2_04000 [Actinomycetota bacterium]